MIKERSIGPNREKASRRPYREIVRDKLNVSGIGEYFHYDEKGHLWAGNLRIVDAVAMYGTPLEIVDTTVVETRCREWRELTGKIAEEIGYKGGFEYFYATKANPSFEIVQTVIKVGWQVETSSAQDLDNLYWMIRNKTVDKERLKIICNGFKLPPQLFGNPVEPAETRSRVVFETAPRRLDATEEVSYADYISLLRELGVKTVPIIDAGELDYFAQAEEIPAMEVGLRMKFGHVTSDDELAKLVSRHGMSWEKIQENAQRIDLVPHLKLTTLHTMVGAAEIIPVDDFVDCLAFAAAKYFELKKSHPSLGCLDIGGGIPPMSENYDYERFLRNFLKEVKRLASQAGLPEPTIIFELGSFVASEAGMTVFKVSQMKRNDELNEWAIVDGGLMASVPDMLMTEKKFEVLAANNANRPAKLVRIGDITCDSDGIFPPKKGEEQRVWVPEVDINTDWPLILVFNDTGAYQNMLSGDGGAHHCLLKQEARLVLQRGNDGRTHAYCVARQTSDELKRLLGYAKR